MVFGFSGLFRLEHKIRGGEAPPDAESGKMLVFNRAQVDGYLALLNLEDMIDFRRLSLSRKQSAATLGVRLFLVKLVVARDDRSCGGFLVRVGWHQARRLAGWRLHRKSSKLTPTTCETPPGPVCLWRQLQCLYRKKEKNWPVRQCISGFGRGRDGNARRRCPCPRSLSEPEEEVVPRLAHIPHQPRRNIHCLA